MLDHVTTGITDFGSRPTVPRPRVALRGRVDLFDGKRHDLGLERPCLRIGRRPDLSSGARAGFR